MHTVAYTVRKKYNMGFYTVAYTIPYSHGKTMVGHSSTFTMQNSQSEKVSTSLYKYI